MPFTNMGKHPLGFLMRLSLEKIMSDTTTRDIVNTIEWSQVWMFIAVLAFRVENKLVIRLCWPLTKVIEVYDA